METPSALLLVPCLWLRRDVMADNIEIVVAGGGTVSLATKEISGVHYPVHATPFGEVCTVWDGVQPYSLAAVDDNRVYSPVYKFSAPINQLSCRIWSEATDWSAPGDGDLWAQIDLSYDQSPDGVTWSPGNSGSNVDGSLSAEYDPDTGGDYLQPSLPYVRFWYQTTPGTGGDEATDTVTLSLKFMAPFWELVEEDTPPDEVVDNGFTTPQLVTVTPDTWSGTGNQAVTFTGLRFTGVTYAHIGTVAVDGSPGSDPNTHGTDLVTVVSDNEATITFHMNNMDDYPSVGGDGLEPGSYVVALYASGSFGNSLPITLV
jgi:hypothetical protein